jgi:hypothetical protein
MRPPGPEQAEPSTTTKVKTPNNPTFKAHHLCVGSLESCQRTMVWAFHRAYGRSNDRMAPLFASRTARTATSCSDFKRTNPPCRALCEPFVWTKTADEVLAKAKPRQKTSNTRH